ncbi:hypothetical protein N0V90_009937 [Kalmusia sp. IMI 367209]|nr:hypothetical protein N0V90_009937 [Kalmusia sp. IMI 367209]
MVASRAKGRTSNARYEPYLTSHAYHGERDEGKENQPPRTSDNLSSQKSDARKEQPSPPKSNSPSAKKGSKKESNRSNLPSNYLDIPLEEADGEVPCYENAAAIRRKLNSLIDKKTKIPNSDKVFNKTTLSKELREVAERTHPVICHNRQLSNGGPSVGALTSFLKQSGSMRGGDSASYYFGNMLLEKLRIWDGQKKTKAREKAEEE